MLWSCSGIPLGCGKSRDSEPSNEPAGPCLKSKSRFSQSLYAESVDSLEVLQPENPRSFTSNESPGVAESVTPSPFQSRSFPSAIPAL